MVLFENCFFKRKIILLIQIIENIKSKSLKVIKDETSSTLINIMNRLKTYTFDS